MARLVLPKYRNQYYSISTNQTQVKEIGKIIDFPTGNNCGFDYIVNRDSEVLEIVGVQCDEISIQMTPCGERVMLGSSVISKKELLEFLLCTGLYDEFKEKIE